MGVNLIKEDGSVIKGPNVASNRPKKSDYDKMIHGDLSDTSHGYSVSKVLVNKKSSKKQETDYNIEEDGDESSL